MDGRTWAICWVSRLTGVEGGGSHVLTRDEAEQRVAYYNRLHPELYHWASDKMG